jgi:hypothetical protein
MTLSNSPEWVPPVDVHVEVDGVTVPVPEVSEALQEITILDNDTVDIANVPRLLLWLRSLRDDEVDAGLQYFTDRWLWDSGHPIDKFFRNILEAERRRRNKLNDKIGRAMSMFVGF